MKIIDRLLNKTKDGFVKENVVIARVGAMDYLGSELGMGLKPNQMYQVHVTADELFSQDTIDSIEGVDATYIHPDALEITLKDWRDLTVGHVQKIYQDGDFLKGTIFIKDKETIDIVEKDGIKEVSLGYDSQIIEKDGKLIKTNIRANHLAIVPGGRCGSACKIGDSKKVNKAMFKKPKKLTLADTVALKLGGKTSHQKAVARKIGDAKKKVADAKTLNDSVKKSLADVEAVLSNPDATDEEKQTALESVSTVSEQITQAIDILDGADSSVDEVEQAVEAIPVADAALPEGVTLEGLEDGVKQYIADLEAESTEATTKAQELQTQLDEANEKIAQLQAQLDGAKTESDTATAVADAKARFPKLKFNDSYPNERKVQEHMLVQKGKYTQDQASKLSDCAIGSAYQALSILDGKQKSTFGKNLVNDSAKTVSAQTRLGGKK